MTRSGAGDDFFVGGLRFCGGMTGGSALTGGKMDFSEISWLLCGLAPSCFEGAGIGSGSMRAGIWLGEGANAAEAGDEIICIGGGGEECLVGDTAEP